MTKVTFGSAITNASLAYDSHTGTFVPQTGAELPQGLVIDQLAPSLS
jgi:hypothetical protein